jgi:type 1 glutamine amidotransferase
MLGSFTRFGTAAALAMALAGSARADGKLRVLILSGQNNHNWRETTPRIKEICELSGRFVVDVTEHPEELTTDTLARCDALISNWNAWGDTAQVKEWPEATRAAFIGFVRGGKGLVSVHAGSSSFYDWPEYQQMVCASWDLAKTGHGPIHEFPVTIADAEHPITRGMRDFAIRDELWHRAGLQPDVKVLATAYSATDQQGTGQQEPVVLAREYGQGRSVTILLGHDLEAMKHPAWCALLTRSTEWAATSEVTLPPPAAP